MIRVSRDLQGARLWLDDRLSGAAVFVDADWIHGADGAAALRIADAPDADAAAALALVVVARSAVAACGAGTVEVNGRGAVAASVRRLLPPGQLAADDGRPSCVVDTSGAPEAIAAACARVDDLGVVVLAGESGGSQVDLNLYPDVHVRGLTLVGIPPATGGE